MFLPSGLYGQIHFGWGLLLVEPMGWKHVRLLVRGFDVILPIRCVEETGGREFRAGCECRNVSARYHCDSVVSDRHYFDGRRILSVLMDEWARQPTKFYADQRIRKRLAD